MQYYICQKKTPVLIFYLTCRIWTYKNINKMKYNNFSIFSYLGTEGGMLSISIIYVIQYLIASIVLYNKQLQKR